MAKLVNKYFKILVNARKRLDEGTPLDQLGFMPPTFDIESDSDVELDSDISLSDDEPPEPIDC